MVPLIETAGQGEFADTVTYQWTKDDVKVVRNVWKQRKLFATSQRSRSRLTI